MLPIHTLQDPRWVDSREVCWHSSSTKLSDLVKSKLELPLNSSVQECELDQRVKDFLVEILFPPGFSPGNIQHWGIPKRKGDLPKVIQEVLLGWKGATSVRVHQEFT